MSSQSIRAVHEQLRTIHSLYRQLKTLASRYKSAQLRVNVQKKKVAETQAHYDELKQKHTEMVLCAREAEDQFNLIDAAIKRRKTQLDEAKSNKEYTSLKEQIAEDQMRNDALADDVISLTEKAENFAPAVEEAKAKIAEAQEAQAAAEEELRALVPVIKEDSQRIQDDLRKKIQEVDSEFATPLRQALRSFDGDDAMAPVENGNICGGCRMEIPMRYIVALCEGHPYTCCSCDRFIYLPKDFTITNDEDD